MSIPIGEFLYEIRKEIGAMAWEVCEGICKTSTYSYYENNQRIPDFLTLNFFLERLGHGITGLAAYVSKEEMEYLEWRREAVRILKEEKWSKLKGQIQKEPKDCSSLNENVRTQYTLFLQAVWEEMEKNQIKEALNTYQKALQCTCSFLLEEKIENHRVGKTELTIYALYLRLLGKHNPVQKSKIAKQLENLLIYIEKKVKDEEEKVNIYPHIVCLWMKFIEKDKLLAKKEKYLEKAYFLLRRERKMYHVTEVLRALIYCKKNRKKEYESEKRAYEAICYLYDFFQKDISFHPFELSESMWMFIILSEYLEKNRKSKNLSQEEISEGICATESYSRIEKGKRSPNQRNYKALTKRMGIEARYMIELVNTGSYKAVKLRKAVDEAIFYGEYVKAEKLLEELKILLRERKEEEENRQYLEMKEILCACGNREIDEEEEHERLKKVLSYTMDLKKIGTRIYSYTRREIDIISPIVYYYQQIGEYEKGIDILKGVLNDMEEGIEEIEQRFRETYLISLNLDKLLTDKYEYLEGNELCMKWAKMAVHRGWATLIDNYLVEISDNMKNIGRYPLEIPKQLCETALELSEVYGTERGYEIIYNYMVTTYGIEYN